MSTTLVLNADALPVSVVPLSTVHWQDAVKIIFKDSASVLAEYDCWVIRSPSVQIRMPSIIMLRTYQNHNGKIEFSRHNVILRDNYTCQYCSKSFPFNELTFDHVIPRRDGGRTEWSNIVSACYGCNQKKAHHIRKPLRKPIQPTYWQLATNRRKRPITIPDESWIDYIHWSGEVAIDEHLRKTNVVQEDDTIPFLKLKS